MLNKVHHIFEIGIVTLYALMRLNRLKAKYDSASCYYCLLISCLQGLLLDGKLPITSIVPRFGNRFSARFRNRFSARFRNRFSAMFRNRFSARFWNRFSARFRNRFSAIGFPYFLTSLFSHGLFLFLPCFNVAVYVIFSFLASFSLLFSTSWHPILPWE